MTVLKNAASLLPSLLLFILVVTTQSQATVIYGGDWSGNDLVPNNGDMLVGTFTNVGAFKIIDGRMLTVIQDLTIYSEFVYFDGTLTIDNCKAIIYYATELPSSGVASFSINTLPPGGFFYCGSGGLPDLPDPIQVDNGESVRISVPEPSTILLMTVALVGFLMWRKFDRVSS